MLMHKVAEVLRFIFNKFFVIGLVIVMIIMIPLLAVGAVVTDREAVKTLLSDSDVYNTVPDNILSIVELEIKDDAQPSEKRTLKQSLEQNNLINPDELISTVKNALGDGFLQNQTESLIDSVYDYIDGSTTDIQYSISLSERSDEIASEFKSFVSSSLEAAPVCPKQSNEDEEFDIFELNCLPANANLESELNKVIDEATTDDGVLAVTYTQDDVDFSSVELAGAQIAYRFIGQLNMLFWIFYIGLMAAVILTGKTIHRGFKIAGVVSFATGLVVLLAFAGAVSSIDAVDKLVIDGGDEFSAEQVQAITNIAQPLADNLTGMITANVITSSVIVVIFGAISFALGVFTTRHHLEHLELHHNSAQTDPTTKSEQAKPGENSSEDNLKNNSHRSEPAVKKPADNAPSVRQRAVTLKNKVSESKTFTDLSKVKPKKKSK